MKKTGHARLRLAEVIELAPRRYGKSTSGRSDSQRTTPRDSRSIAIANDSPAGFTPYATLLKCPVVVLQRFAKPLRSAVGNASQNSLNSMNISHHMVGEHATPFGGFTKQCQAGDNSRMEIKQLAEVRRANTRRLVGLRYDGNKSALARAYQEVSKQEHPTPNLFGDLLRDKSKKAFGEKLARSIEAAARLKPFQLDIQDSPLEMDESRIDRTEIELQTVMDNLTKTEKQDLIAAAKEIMGRRKRPKRA